MTDESRISIEVARAEFDRWADAWDIDTDKSQMDEDDKQGFENAKNQFVRFVSRGNIVVNEDPDTVNVHLRNGDELTFKIPTGAAWLTMDHHKSNRDTRKFFAYMAAMCGREVSYFSRMDGRDVKVCQSLVILFLG